MNISEDFKKQIVRAMTIFPSLVAFGLFLNIITSQKISWLFWLKLPAVIFDKLFNIKSLELSENIILSSIFAFFFWMGISMLSGYIGSKFSNKNNG